jgi:hypothetical protein
MDDWFVGVQGRAEGAIGRGKPMTTVIPVLAADREPQQQARAKFWEERLIQPPREFEIVLEQLPQAKSAKESFGSPQR